jgi:hypothetical protein
MRVWSKVRRAFTVGEEEKWISFGSRLHIANRYLFLGVLAVSVYVFFLNVSVFMDDVFIYLRVVENIVDGAGPVLNAGDHHFPVTSPLWVFLLTFLKMIFGFIDLVLLSKIVSIIFLAGASSLAFLLLRRYIGHWAVLAPVPIFFNFIAVTTVGGEIALVYFCLFGVLWSYFSKHNFILTGVATAAAYLARPELILILPVIALHYLFHWRKEKKALRILLTDWGKLAIVFLAVVSVWHVYNYIQFDSFFPGTLKTKTIQGKSGMWTLYYHMGRKLTLEMLGQKYWLVIPLFFGLIYFREISLSLLLYTTLHYYAYKFLVVPYYHWYFYDFFILIPMFTLFGIIGLSRFIGRAFKIGTESTSPPRQFPVWSTISTGFLVLFLAAYSIFITTKVKCLPSYREDGRLDSYRRIADSIRPEARKGDIVLSPEIGIIGYYLKDTIIRDLNGIASPDTSLENINNLDYFVSTYSPKFIIFPHFMNQRESFKYFALENGKRLLYKLEYPRIDISTPIDSVFSLASSRERRKFLRWKRTTGKLAVQNAKKMKYARRSTL